MASKRSRATYEADLQAQQSPYVFYGTPLPPFDPDVRDDGSYVPVWKQEVTDDRGRKRLHGAFTGGFSAGYFNTVGSKEGWTPSTFVSSKSNRRKDALATQQRPEDYMDEEDIADAEEAKTLATSETFAGLGTMEEDLTRRGGAVMDILRASGDTMGVKLLRKMGWREGQGIGPKVRRKARLDEEEDTEAPESQATHLFAPENSEMISFVRKNNRKGLGYEGETRLVDVESSDQYPDQDEIAFTKPLKKDKPKPKRGGFGVGILNDNSDDEDPYHVGPQISYSRVMGGDKKTKKKPINGKPHSTSSNPLLRTKPVFISKKTATSKAATTSRRCHDGRPPLPGFVLSTDLSTSLLNKTSNYPPPTIPEGWKSSKQPHLTASTPTVPPSSYQSSASLAHSPPLNPSARATLLGETPLPSKSVFDYLTPSARSRLATASQNPNLPPALSEAPPPGHTITPTDLASLVPPLDPAIASTALGRGVAGWMPYAEDATKRLRYRSFLEFRAGLRDVLPEHATGISTQDWVKEMQEFAHAATIFKPMTGMMASRFTSSRSGGAADTAKKEAGNEKGEDGEGDGSLLSRPAEKMKDPAEEAARLGMFGPLTRTTTQFFPSRLLCKRFNVPAPAHVMGDPGGPGTPNSSHSRKTEPSGSSASAEGAFGGRFQSSGFQTSSKNLDLVGEKQMEELRRESRVVSGQGEGALKREVIVVDPERNEALEKERPGDAVFRAIFGSDSEGDE